MTAPAISTPAPPRPAAEAKPAAKPAAGDYPGTASLAMALAGVSGYVDAVGVSLLAGLYVSFMSGNTTSTGLAVGHGLWAKAAHAGLPIPLYVLGSLVGALLVAPGPRALARTYGLTALPLALFAVLTLLVPHRSAGAEALAVALLVLPMGMVNATLRHVGPTSVGLGYVTGTLASLGEELASLVSGSRKAGLTQSIWLHVRVWLGFFLGGVVGAFGTHWWSSWAVFVPVVALLALAVHAARHPLQEPAAL